MPYNPYGPGGPLYRGAPLFRTTVATPANPKDAELRADHAAVSAADAAREAAGEPVTWDRVTLASESPRGRRYATDTEHQFILARPSGQGAWWEVLPCGPRSGVADDAPRLGRGSTPQDALEDAGYREVAK